MTATSVDPPATSTSHDGANAGGIATVVDDSVFLAVAAAVDSTANHGLGQAYLRLDLRRGRRVVSALLMYPGPIRVARDAHQLAGASATARCANANDDCARRATATSEGLAMMLAGWDRTLRGRHAP